MRLDSHRVIYAELFVSILLLLVHCKGTQFLLFLSDQLAAAGLAFYVFVIAFLIAYVYWANGAQRAKHPIALHALFASAVAAFLLPFALGIGLYLNLLLKAVQMFTSAGLFLMIFIPLFFLAFTAAYLVRLKGDRRHAVLLLILALLVLILVFSAKFIVTWFSVDDEEFLAMQSIRLMLSGADPYAVSVAGLIYSNTSSMVPTMTTSNGIIGTMDYPALFFLTLAPFYFVSAPTLQNVGGIDLPLQAAVFIFALLAVFAFTMKKEDLLKPRITLLALFAIVPIYYISSITTYLMLALLLLAYAKIDSRYAWLPLGLCLSLQEELWLPVIFLIAYSLTRQGVRRAAMNVIGAAGVFVACNAYFIALSPSAFFGSLFSPLSKTLLPITSSPIAFSLMKWFPVQLQAYSLLFSLLSALLLLIFLYKGRKELIPLFSFLPLLVLPHSLPSYYTFFLFFALFAVCTAKGKRRSLGVVEAFLRKRKYVMACAVAVVVACTALALLSSHAAYKRNFNITLQDQSLSPIAGTNFTAYRASIAYSGLGNGTVYMMVIAHAGFSSGVLGLLNDTIVVPAPAAVCATYECHVNTNRIVLPLNGTFSRISATLPWLNGTQLDRVRRLRGDSCQCKILFHNSPLVSEVRCRAL